MPKLTRAKRISELRDRLTTGARLSLQRIHSDYDVSLRTARRDIEGLVGDWWGLGLVGRTLTIHLLIDNVGNWWIGIGGSDPHYSSFD